MSGGEHEDALGCVAFADVVPTPPRRGRRATPPPRVVSDAERDELFALLARHRKQRQTCIRRRAMGRMRHAFYDDLMPDLMQEWDVQLLSRLPRRDPAMPLERWLRVVFNHSMGQAVWVVMRDLCLLGQQGKAIPPMCAVELDEDAHLPAHLGLPADRDAWEVAHWVLAANPAHRQHAEKQSRFSEWRHRPTEATAARAVAVTLADRTTLG